MTPHLMRAFARMEDVEAVRGEGCYLFDACGRKYLDFLGGVAVNALGHCHPALVEALTRQAGVLWHASNLVRVPEQERLADRLCANSFADAVFFTNSGSEAVDFALKLVRRYFKGTATPERWRVITFDGAFHGRSMADIAAGGQAKLVQGYEPVVPGFDCVPFGDLPPSRPRSGRETAAILLEPVQGDGGIRVFPPEFIRALRQIADRRRLLLVLDEVQTGIGRTGKLFAYEWAEIRPDIVAVAKGLGAGFPLGATLATAAVAKTITPGTHGSTLGGSPLGMSVAHALLDVVLADGFLDKVGASATSLREGLDDLAARHPQVIEEVRGLGLLLGIKCRSSNQAMMASLRRHGLLTAPAGDNVVRLLPPLIIEQQHIDEALAALEAAFRELSADAAALEVKQHAPAA